MTQGSRHVVVIPCSGIGKSLGSVAREAAYVATEDLRPDTGRVVALSKLVLGDAEARAAVAGHPTVTVDGCKLACAATMVRESGGERVRALSVLDTYRRHKDLKPEGIAALNEAGVALARILGEEIAHEVDVFLGEDGAEDGTREERHA